MSRIADVYARISPKLAGKPGTTLPTKVHAWVLRRSGGRVGKRFLGGEVAVVRTVGRRSGQVREAPMFYLRDGDTIAVVASNAASERPPAWWLNLQAQPEADVYADGAWHAIRARAASPAETAKLWPRFVSVYKGYDHYKDLATRELPIVLLELR